MSFLLNRAAALGAVSTVALCATGLLEQAAVPADMQASRSGRLTTSNTKGPEPIATGGTVPEQQNSCWTYTTADHFAVGHAFNLTPVVDPTGETCLTLNDDVRTWPFIGVACSGRDTIVRIAVQNLPQFGLSEGDVLGEYLTRPNGLSGNPSRTSVDPFGNIWVGNRAEGSPVNNVPMGSMTRVGLVLGGTRTDASGNPDPTGQYLAGPFAYCTCEDRDGDGLIKTSRGYPHTTGAQNADYVNTILPWSNAANADTAGGVSTADDECITAYVRTVPTYVRHVSIDPNGDPWIGSSPILFGGNGAFEKLDGSTGQPALGSVFSPTNYCAGYGGLVDKNGTIWSAGNFGGVVMRKDNPPSGATTCITVPNYGIAIDPQTNYIWTSSGPNVYRINPTTNVPSGGTFHGANGCQGMTIDTLGNVWVAHDGASPSIGRLDNNVVSPTWLGNVNLTVNPAGAPAAGPSGVAIDTNNKVWATNLSTDNVMRADPNGGGAGTVDLVVDLGTWPLHPNAYPYNYSDMTGSVLLQSVAPQGSWTVVHDGGKPNCDWGTLTWSANQGPGTSVTVRVRAGNTATPTGPWTYVSNGVPFTGVTGRYLQVQVILKRAAKSHGFVSFCDLTICKYQPCASVDEGEVICEANGSFTYNFDLTNNTNQPVKYIVILPPSGVTITPNTFNFAVPLAPGGTTTLSVNITGAADNEEMCFRMNLLNPQAQQCCAVDVCVTPRCDCLRIVEQSVVCSQDGTGDLIWTFTIMNLTTSPGHHFFLIPTAPSGVTMSPNYFNIAVLPPGGTTTLTTTISGATPGQPVSVFMSLHDANLYDCCGIDHTFDTPLCKEKPKGTDTCHLTALAQCCFPQDTQVTTTLTICNNSSAPASYNWSVESLAGCPIQIPASAFSPQSGVVNIGPGACISIAISIPCDVLYGQMLGATACLTTQVVNKTTGQVMKCIGEVGSTPPGVACLRGPSDPVMVRFPENAQLDFIASQAADGTLSVLPYSFQPQSALVSLNNGTPGGSVNGYVFLPAGVPVPITLMARFTEHVPGVHDLLVFADLNGDGQLELAMSLGLISTSGPQPSCTGDLNIDGTVDVLDLLMLLGAWGACPPGGNCKADLNADGIVDVLDLLTLLGAWGPCF